MDVRCEKCQTEYELDESRLKPGGVTVKCTTCGHMFKIRKRTITQSGIQAHRAHAASGPAPVPAPPRPQSGSGPVPGSGVPGSALVTGSGPVTGGEGERNWILRMENGETRPCKELGVLQQWIVTGTVSRETMISRSGKTWKRLGDIPDLSSFFVVADEARAAREAREAQRSPLPPQPTPPTAAPAPGPTSDATRRTMAGIGAVSAPVASQPAALERDTVVDRVPTPAAAARPSAAATTPTMVPTRPAAPPPAPRAPAAAPTLLSSDVAATPVAAPAPARLPQPAAAPPSDVPLPGGDRKTGAWVTDDVRRLDGGEHEGDADGPRRGAVRATGGDGFGGVVRADAGNDAVFAGGRGSAHDAYDPLDSLSDLPVRRSGAGLWIALGSLVVIAAAAAVVYVVFVRPPAKAAGTGSDSDAQEMALADGGADLLLDAGTAEAPVDDLIDQARAQLARDSAAALVATERILSDGGKGDAITLGMRARLLTGHAQILADQAELSDAKTADKVRREARKVVLTALGLAQRAIKAGSSDPVANLAMADVLRLQGKPAKDLRRYLDAARTGEPREVALIEALVAARDGHGDKAVVALAELDRGTGALEATGDVRPRWQRARVLFAQHQNDAARKAAQEVLGVQPEHAGARALVAAVEQAGDALPPEVGSGSGAGTASGVHTGGGGPSVAEGYDRLLAKANKLAEVDCGQAMPYFARALEAQPNGVEALTGMGFCHIDAKQFASAHSKFRAALGISPRFERALWGVAEAYQQQGRADLAIKAYKEYLEVYPGSAAAQRQVERLQGKAPGTPTPPEPDGPATSPGGGSGTGGGGDSGDRGDGAGGGSGAGSAPPSDPGPGSAPTPTPTPDPAPEGAATTP